MSVFLKILYPVLEGVWRWFFGCSIIKRFVLHVINVIATSFVLWYCGISLFIVAPVVAIYEAFYWSVGHGPAFDMGRGGKPDEEMIKRYKKYFWNKWCEFIVPEEYWYTFGYDYLWMFFRYEIPAILISTLLLNFWFAFAGFAVSTIYAICWSLSDKDELHGHRATRVAEILSGFVSGLLLII